MSERQRLRDALSDRQPEERVQRMWTKIDAGRHRTAWGASPRKLLLLIPLAAAAVLFLFLRDPGPLTVDGNPFPERVEVRAIPDRVRLSDGSELVIDSNSQLELLENSGEVMALALRRGRAHVSVVPGGPRLWRIECGRVIVQVIGTEFDVSREHDRVAVRVDHGVVLVRGPAVPDGVQRLSAGEELVVGELPQVQAPIDASTVQNPEPVVEEPVVEEPVVDEAPPPPPTEIPDVSSWRAAARRGAYSDAYQELGPVGIQVEVQRARGVDELMELADVARLSGHPADAADPLERIVSEQPGDPRAALAAYWLGQVRFQLGDPAGAADAYEQSLQLGLPHAMREAATARRIEALAHAYDPRLSSAVESYLEAYPDGRYRGRVEGWSRE